MVAWRLRSAASRAEYVWKRVLQQWWFFFGIIDYFFQRRWFASTCNIAGAVSTWPVDLTLRSIIFFECDQCVDQYLWNDKGCVAEVFQSICVRQRRHSMTLHGMAMTSALHGADYFLVDCMRANFFIVLNPCVCLPDDFFCCHRTCFFLSHPQFVVRFQKLNFNLCTCLDCRNIGHK